MTIGIVEDFIQEATATTGAGLTLTLTAMDGYARFSDVFSVSDVVYYTIRNGNNVELGRGTVQTGNTLDRTTPIKTLVAGAFDDTSPAKITLVGSSVVACAPSKAYLDDITQFRKIVTDTTDISLVDIASSQTNFGSSFSATIPTEGLINLTGIYRTQSDSAATADPVIGIRISSTNYWPYYSDNGTVTYTANVRGPVTSGQYAEGFGGIPNQISAGQSHGIDIAKNSVPTGSQTIQIVVARGSADTGTIKGTAVTSRVFIEILDGT